MKLVYTLLVFALLGLSNARTLSKGTKGRTYGNFGPQIKQTFEIKPEPRFHSGSNDPIDIAIHYLAQENAIDVSKVRVTAFHKNKKNGVTHVYLQQFVNGLDVVNAVANVNVNVDGNIVSVGNGFFKNAVPEADLTKLVKLTASDAVLALSKLLGLDVPANLVTTERIAGEPFSYVVSGAHFALSEIAADLKYMQVEDGSKLSTVWDIRVEMKDNVYNAFVDTVTGEVVSLIDWVSDATYNAYPLGVNDPDSGSRALIVDPANPVASPLGWHNQGEGIEFTDTRGNNVLAQINPDGGSDYIDNYRPDGGPNHIFDFPIDFTKDPTEYVDAATTNLFHMNNIIHDLFHVYGFDEASGNFQHNNFGRGGEGNDEVVAFAQDGSGTNNANFYTPPDGLQGRMRMYIWTVTEPRRDGNLDAGIVVHEYAHGISTRLTGGPLNVGCVAWGEPGGMGEGWGDFFATITRTTANSTRNDDFAMGAYDAAHPAGIREYLYSTSMETNPHTYGFLAQYEYNPVHMIGQVWVAMLYEVYWNLVEKNGFESDWFNANSTAGNIMMFQLVVDGMKLQPCYPSFVDARNAIIQADELNNDGDNFCEIWRGFAKRGLGVNAVAGNDDDWEWTGIENFEVPPSCT